ncbi:MAG: hypothetical protein JSU72_16635 [Deltaproteobacteria bacterium]|nr:MAG: hypothetical protein JSU72_16635 [Deltaproteobacteria bacterium]
MVNPFQDFKDFLSKGKSLPLDRLAAAHDKVMAELTTGYSKLVEQELKSLVWFVEHNRVIEAYKTASEMIKEIDYDGHSIEEFCYHLDSGTDMPYMISGPAGIFIAALCNHVPDDSIVLRLGEMQRTLHFLGYRLPYGKSLSIDGNVGNFTGAALQGGEITVSGFAGDWTGAGMTEGKITIHKHCGRNTGEWMQGGEVWVGSRIRGLGRVGSGQIYLAGEPVAGDPESV